MRTKAVKSAALFVLVLGATSALWAVVATVIEAPLYQRAEDGSASMGARISDFPQTYISRINIDLTSPNHWVRLTWSGPNAVNQNRGPMRSCPGAGIGVDCNDVAQSNKAGSNCTPKGAFVVAAFSDYLPTVPECHFVTWFHVEREIGIHGHWAVLDNPASHGCVRMSDADARLIHNNSIAGRTVVNVSGTWSYGDVHSANPTSVRTIKEADRKSEQCGIDRVSDKYRVSVGSDHS